MADNVKKEKNHMNNQPKHVNIRIPHKDFSTSEAKKPGEETLWGITANVLENESLLDD